MQTEAQRRAGSAVDQGACAIMYAHFFFLCFARPSETDADGRVALCARVCLSVCSGVQ